MEALAVETKQVSSPNDEKNEIIEQAVSSPTRVPVKSSGIVNSNSKYMWI